MLLLLSSSILDVFFTANASGNDCDIMLSEERFIFVAITRAGAAAVSVETCGVVVFVDTAVVVVDGHAVLLVVSAAERRRADRVEIRSGSAPSAHFVAVILEVSAAMLLLLLVAVLLAGFVISSIDVVHFVDILYAVVCVGGWRGEDGW